LATGPAKGRALAAISACIGRARLWHSMLICSWAKRAPLAGQSGPETQRANSNSDEKNSCY